MTKPRAYYNDNDKKVCEWLRQLIKDKLIMEGDVDDRSIKEIEANDVMGYTRVHFFAGIGGWDRVLRLAGWSEDEPVWTGSCPCQSYSCAGKRQGQNDPRHLWPDFFRIIKETRPQHVFGEQVVGAIRHQWLDGVYDDLEKEDYTVGSIVLPACSVGSPHLRQRIWWMAHSSEVRWRKGTNTRGFKREEGKSIEGRGKIREKSSDSCRHSGMANTSSDGCKDTGEKTNRVVRKGEERGMFESKGICTSVRYPQVGEQSNSYDSGMADSRLFGSKKHEKQTEGSEQCGETGGLADTRCSETHKQGTSGQTKSSEDGKKDWIFSGDGDGSSWVEDSECSTFGSASGKSSRQRRESMDAREESLRQNDGSVTSDGSRSGSEGGDIGTVSNRNHSEFWRYSVAIPCSDGRSRRLELRPTEMDDGISKELDEGGEEGYQEFEVVSPLINKEDGRKTILSGYGNAIVPQVGAMVVESYIEILDENLKSV